MKIAEIAAKLKFEVQNTPHDRMILLWKREVPEEISATHYMVSFKLSAEHESAEIQKVMKAFNIHQPIPRCGNRT